MVKKIELGWYVYWKPLVERPSADIGVKYMFFFNVTISYILTSARLNGSRTHQGVTYGMLFEGKVFVLSKKQDYFNFTHSTGTYTL